MSANLFEKVTTVSFEKPPKVSVIMPYHNEGDLLARSLQSVFDQEVDFDVEIVLIDDCSDLKPKLPSSPRFPIQHLRTTSNVYAGQARNIGIGECHGELICFLDSDDEYAAGRLSSAVEFLDQHPEVDFVFCSFYIHRGGPNLQVPQAFEDLFEEPPPTARVLPEEFRWHVVKKYPFHTGCITARRDLLLQHKFDPNLFWGEEWDVFVRISQQAKAGYIPEPGFHYHCRDGSVCSTNNPKKHISKSEMFRAWQSIPGLPKSFRQDLRRRERMALLLAGQILFEDFCQTSQALGCAFRSLQAGVSVWGLRSLVRYSLASVLPFNQRAQPNSLSGSRGDPQSNRTENHQFPPPSTDFPESIPEIERTVG